MSTADMVSHIGKLIGRKNFSVWSFGMKNYLEHEDLLASIEGSENDVNKLARAKSEILFMLDRVNYGYVKDCNTAKRIWDKLFDKYDDSKSYRRVSLLEDCSPDNEKSISSRSKHNFNKEIRCFGCTYEYKACDCVIRQLKKNAKSENVSTDKASGAVFSTNLMDNDNLHVKLVLDLAASLLSLSGDTIIDLAESNVIHRRVELLEHPNCAVKSMGELFINPNCLWTNIEENLKHRGSNQSTQSVLVKDPKSVKQIADFTDSKLWRNMEGFNSLQKNSSLNGKVINSPKGDKMKSNRSDKYPIEGESFNNYEISVQIENMNDTVVLKRSSSVDDISGLGIDSLVDTSTVENSTVRRCEKKFNISRVAREEPMHIYSESCKQVYILRPSEPANTDLCGPKGLRPRNEFGFNVDIGTENFKSRLELYQLCQTKKERICEIGVSTPMKSSDNPRTLRLGNTFGFHVEFGTENFNSLELYQLQMNEDSPIKDECKKYFNTLQFIKRLVIVIRIINQLTENNVLMRTTILVNWKWKLECNFFYNFIFHVVLYNDLRGVLGCKSLNTTDVHMTTLLSDILCRT